LKLVQVTTLWHFTDILIIIISSSSSIIIISILVNLPIAEADQ